MKKPENDRAIRVAIADDHALFRAGVKTAMAVKKDIELIAEADNGMQLLNLLKHVDVDVILLDIQMPIMDGIQTLPEIRKLKPDAKVIILSMHNDHSMISKLMEIGANSYLTKNSDSETIYQAIKTCYEQEFFFNELTNKALLTGIRTKRNDIVGPQDVNLSDKEFASNQQRLNGSLIYAVFFDEKLLRTSKSNIDELRKSFGVGIVCHSYLSY